MTNTKKSMQSLKADEREQEKGNFSPQPHLKGKKIICRVWSSEGKFGMPVVVARTKVKFGTFKFEIRGLGSSKRYYKINYQQLKQDGKNFIYDTHFDSTTGALSFSKFPEDMASDEAYTVFENNAVKMYVAKGGIPLIYLLVAMVLVVVALFAIILTVPAGLQAQEQVKQLDLQVTALKQQNSVLNQQNTDLRNSQQ